MLPGRKELALQINQIADGLILMLMLLAARTLRSNRIIDFDFLPTPPPLENFLWLFFLVGLFGPLLLEIQGFYQYPLDKTVGRSLRQISHAAVWLGLIIGACVVFLKLPMPSRSTFVLFMLLAPVGLIARERFYATLRLRRLRRGADAESVVLAGSPGRMEELVESLTPVQRLEINIAEKVDLEKSDTSELVEAMHRHSVGRVILAFDDHTAGSVQESIAACETEGVEAWLAADFFRASIARPSYDALGGTPMLVFRVTPELSWALFVKNAMDRVASFFALIVLAPFFLVVAVIIKITSPGPVIFKQQRAGLHGKPFTMYKFRSMRSGAEMERAELMAFNQMSGPVFKIEKDPRVTRFGAWLRRTSVDELPQLFNVLLGQMSLVGPRPLPVYEVENFALTAHRRRLSMKPGLTCLWQISGRNAVKDFHDWVKLDVQYIDNWSLGLDLAILLRTVPVVLLGKGAH